MMITAMREAVQGRLDRTKSRRFADLARRVGGSAERFAPYLHCDGHLASPNLIAAHRKGYETLKSVGIAAPVGVTLALHDMQAEPGGEAARDAALHLIEDRFLETLHGDDFVGVQTYTRFTFSRDGRQPPPRGAELTQMGYEFYPDALEATIRRASRISGCPVLVTENGIGTEDDTRRIAYTTRALDGVLRCLADGIDVRGYIHWSMLDNYEWLEGYRPRFGLIEVDRATQARKPKPSAYWLGGIAKANAMA